MSIAAASSSWSTQNTPKARRSGRPMAPPKMYSGDSAVPVMRRVRRLPLISADTEAPGLRPCASAKDTVTTVSSCPPLRVPASGQRPLRNCTWLSRCGRRASRPIS